MKNETTERVVIKSRFVNRPNFQGMAYQVYLDGKLYCGGIYHPAEAQKMADALKAKNAGGAR